MQLHCKSHWFTELLWFIETLWFWITVTCECLVIWSKQTYPLLVSLIHKIPDSLSHCNSVQIDVNHSGIYRFESLSVIQRERCDSVGALVKWVSVYCQSRQTLSCFFFFWETWTNVDDKKRKIYTDQTECIFQASLLRYDLQRSSWTLAGCGPSTLASYWRSGGAVVWCSEAFSHLSQIIKLALTTYSGLVRGRGLLSGSGVGDHTRDH